MHSKLFNEYSKPIKISEAYYISYIASISATKLWWRLVIRGDPAADRGGRLVVSTRTCCS